MTTAIAATPTVAQRGRRTGSELASPLGVAFPRSDVGARRASPCWVVAPLALGHADVQAAHMPVADPYTRTCEGPRYSGSAPRTHAPSHGSRPAPSLCPEPVVRQRCSRRNILADCRVSRACRPACASHSVRRRRLCLGVAKLASASQQVTSLTGLARMQPSTHAAHSACSPSRMQPTAHAAHRSCSPSRLQPTARAAHRAHSPSRTC